MRLIDADLLMRSFQVDMCGGFACHECPLLNDDGECGFEVFISDTPTVDAVEVVRCKDCNHKGWIQEPCHGKSVDFCNVFDSTINNPEKCFCYYGERKRNETD